jgi:hypothetical protein
MRTNTHRAISSAQLHALHSIFRVCAQRGIDVCARPGSLPGGPVRREEWDSSPIQNSSLLTDSREQRLELASRILGRIVFSFSDLSFDEASSLLDSAKKALGQYTAPRSRRNRPDREQALAYGTAGRRENKSKEIRLVDAPTMELIRHLTAQLGWTEERFSAFLRSSTSPVKSGAIRTLPEANRVIWALKNMLRTTKVSCGNVSHSKEEAR